MFVSFSCLVVRRLRGAAKRCCSTATHMSLRSSRRLVHSETRQYRRIQKELLCATKGALSQVAERKDAEGLIGFLTERRIFFLSMVQANLSHRVFVGLLLGCLSCVPHPPASLGCNGVGQVEVFLLVCRKKSSRGSYSSHHAFLAGVE